MSIFDSPLSLYFIFGLITVVIITVYVIVKIHYDKSHQSNIKGDGNSSNTGENSGNIGNRNIQQNINITMGESNQRPSVPISNENSRSIKQENILFIDDQEVDDLITVLKNAGWSNVHYIKDVINFDIPEILDAKLILVDIEDVGAKISKDEGLGVAKRIKSRYPSKKIVIYSAKKQSLKKEFHDFDGVLFKNADPLEFFELFEELLKDENQ